MTCFSIKFLNSISAIKSYPPAICTDFHLFTILCNSGYYFNLVCIICVLYYTSYHMVFVVVKLQLLFFFATVLFIFEELCIILFLKFMNDKINLCYHKYVGIDT